MKPKLDYRAYIIHCNGIKYRIDARSTAEAINTVRFKYCYMIAIDKTPRYSIVDRLYLKELIKNFDLGNITLLYEGDIVQIAEESKDKRLIKRDWKMLKEFEDSMILEDAERHEKEMMC